MTLYVSFIALLRNVVFRKRFILFAAFRLVSKILLTNKQLSVCFVYNLLYFIPAVKYAFILVFSCIFTYFIAVKCCVHSLILYIRIAFRIRK